MFAMRDEAPTVVWVHSGNTRKADLLSWFDRIVELVESGQKLIELR